MWNAGLDADQQARCRALMRRRAATQRQPNFGRDDGWSIYATPSLGRPYYLELRLRIAGQIVRRHVITDERPHTQNGPPMEARSAET